MWDRSLSSPRQCSEVKFYIYQKTVPFVSPMWCQHCVLEHCMFVVYACAFLEPLISSISPFWSHFLLSMVPTGSEENQNGLMAPLQIKPTLSTIKFLSMINSGSAIIKCFNLWSNVQYVAHMLAKPLSEKFWQQTKRWRQTDFSYIW